MEAYTAKAKQILDGARTQTQDLLSDWLCEARHFHAQVPRMESFFATLKKEKLYQLPTYRMKCEEVKTVIFRYIFGYYNTQRINSFNQGGLPPVALRSSTGPAHHAA